MMADLRASLTSLLISLSMVIALTLASSVAAQNAPAETSTEAATETSGAAGSEAGSQAGSEAAAEPANTDAAPIPEEEAGRSSLLDLIQDVDMDTWVDLANRADAVIESGAGSDEILETLRAQVADFRRQFLDAQTVNASRIATIRRQIAALTAATPEGEEEAFDVTVRREELSEDLTRLRAPVIAAEEAYNRANGIVAEIDSIIRERQTDQLMELGPSPLNPAYWAPAWRALRGSVTSLSREITEAWSLQSRREALTGNLPAVLFYFSVALLFVLRGRVWARRAGIWILERSPRGGRVWSALVSAGQILLPLVGIFALVQAVEVSGLLGIRGELIIGWLPVWALVFLGVRWLADRLFSEYDGDRMLPMPRIHRQEARFYAGLFSIVSVVRGFIDVIGNFDGYGQAVQIVLDFPLMLLTALVLYRLGYLLRTKVEFQVPQGEDDDRPPPMRARLVRFFGRAAGLIAILGPVLAVVGYTAAAAALVYPAVATLLLAGLLLLLQRFTSDLYRFVTRQADDEEDSLITVLIGFLLALGAIPVLALVWGARVADITEVWTRFREGLTLGETRIQPTDFLTFVAIFLVLYSATRLLQSALKNTVLPKTNMDQGARTAIVSGVGYVGIFLAALVAISATGLDLSSVAIVAGALSVGIGFGLQNIVSNFVSGIILLIERPIAEGDWIEVGGNMGYVRDISVRSTRIQTFDRSDVIVPNADLVSGTVTNYTRGNTIGRVIIPVGVAYGTDTRRVERVLMDIARQHDMVLMNPAPSVVFQGFGADSMDFEIRAILRDVNYMLSVKSDMNHEIARRFAEEEIEIPFAQRDVWLRNPEVLAPAPPQSVAQAQNAPNPAKDSPEAQDDGDTT
ncbi:DUF3772 domain-containing protein [Roseobacteraceae bacterium S113]